MLLNRKSIASGFRSVSRTPCSPARRTRDNTCSSMPSDDGSAFDTDASSIFALTGLSCILVPWALAKLFNLLAGKPSEPQQWKALGFSPSAPVVRKAERLRVSWFRIANLLFVLGWAAECQLIGGAILAYEQQLFDPYPQAG